VLEEMHTKENWFLSSASLPLSHNADVTICADYVAASSKDKKLKGRSHTHTHIALRVAAQEAFVYQRNAATRSVCVNCS